jgi:hypothetical protein
MTDSSDNLETRIERMPFDALKSKCDSVVEGFKSKSATAPGRVDRPTGNSHSDHAIAGRARPGRSIYAEGPDVGEVVSAFEARIDHLEKKLLGMQNENRKQLRSIKRAYRSGIALTIVLTLLMIGASVVVQVF